MFTRRGAQATAPPYLGLGLQVSVVANDRPQWLAASQEERLVAGRVQFDWSQYGT